MANLNQSGATASQDRPAVSLADFASSNKTGMSSAKTPPTDTGAAAQRMQSNLVKREPKGRLAGLFSSYRPSGATVKYADNKVGILPNVLEVIAEIAEHAGVEIDDEDARARLLDALVTDVYINAYSEEKSFEGFINIAGIETERYHIRDVLIPYVGSHFRRFARALAPFVIATMHNNKDFYELLDKRAMDLNLNSREEALYAFDGADAIVAASRNTAQRNAEAKSIALAKRREAKAFDMLGSAHGKSISGAGSTIA